MRHRLSAAAILFGTVCALASAQNPTYVALIVYHVTNVGKAPIENTLVSCRIPATNRYQQVIDSAIDPAPQQTREDSTGQTLALVDLGALAPGQTKAVYLICWARGRTATLRPASEEEDDEGNSLTDEDRAAYLEDAPPFGIEQVRAAAQEICGRASSSMGKAKAIFDYITTNFEYDMRDHLDSAPAVIKRKEGSCSELAFAFVALCRAVDVPARIVTAFRNREGATPSVDWVGHRWAEFYADNIGWVPADPTSQINAFGRKSYWARQDPEFIALVDDGASTFISPRWEAMLAFYQPADSTVTTKRCATWRLSRDMQKERDFFDNGCRMLQAPDPKERIAAMEAWERGQEPLRGAFALEAAFDRDASVRRQAAKTLATAGDSTLTLPMLRIQSNETDETVKEALIHGIKSILADKNDKYRVLALANLVKSRLEDAVPLAVAMVNDQSPDVRWELAATLHKLGNKPAVNDAYAVLLDDPEEIVRFQAAKQWTRLGSWVAAERLMARYLTSPDSRRRTSALQTLRQRAGEDFDFDPLVSPNSPGNKLARERWDRWLHERGEP